MQRRGKNSVGGTERQLFGLRDKGRTSIGASRQSASIMASTAAPSRISQRIAVTLPPESARIRADVASRNSSRRPQITSSAPSSRKRRPIAAPSPEPPPVTRIRFPLSRSFSNIV
jgi:hypothetical protein